MTVTVLCLIPPLITFGGAIICVGLLGWYWRRLGRESVPESRRRIRRASILTMFVAIADLVIALSFVDGDLEPQRFTIVWTVFLALLWLIVMMALFDAFNNMRIHRRETRDMTIDAALGLGQAIRDSKSGREKAAGANHR